MKVGGYGEADNNIGNLHDKPLKTITSPPYEDIRICTTENQGIEASGERVTNRKYGETEGNIGNSGESYLDAMRVIYSEVGKVSDVLAIVLKNPTRAGKLRRLDLDSIRLLEETGWTIHCQHKALLFEELEQGGLFGESTKRVKGRLSFFKRLSWQKGNAVASWEDVIIATRTGGGNLKTISSPPYTDQDGKGLARRNRQVVKNSWAVPDEKPRQDGYGQTPGQIGNLKDK